MQDLQQTANMFERCVGLDPAAREALLRSIEDRQLALRLRGLLEADAAAERGGFLTPLPH